jgi:hypothetical protein
MNLRMMRSCDLHSSPSLYNKHDNLPPSSLIFVLAIVFLFLQHLKIDVRKRNRVQAKSISYLDELIGCLDKMLPTLTLRALRVPVYDGLIRDTVFVIQNLRNCFSKSGQNPDQGKNPHCPSSNEGTLPYGGNSSRFLVFNPAG